MIYEREDPKMTIYWVIWNFYLHLQMTNLVDIKARYDGYIIQHNKYQFRSPVGSSQLVNAEQCYHQSNVKQVLNNQSRGHVRSVSISIHTAMDKATGQPN